MIAIISARYSEREALEVFLGDIFPDGKASVKVGIASWLINFHADI